MTGILDKIIEMMLDLINPITTNINKPKMLYRYFQRMGWNLENILDSAIIGEINTALMNFQALAEDLKNNANFSDIPSTIDTLVKVVDLIIQINEIQEKLSNGVNFSLDRIADLGIDLFETLLLDYIYQSSPVTYEILYLLTVIESEKVDLLQTDDTTSSDPIRFPVYKHQFKPENIRNLLTDPINHLKSSYLPSGLSGPDEAKEFSHKLFGKLSLLIQLMGGYASYGFDRHNITLVPDDEFGRTLNTYFKFPITDAETGRISSQAIAGFTITVIHNETTDTSGNQGPGLSMKPYGSFIISIPLGNWILSMEVNGNIGRFFIAQNKFRLSEDPNSQLSVNLDFSRSEGAPIIFGSAEDTRLEIGGLRFNINALLNPSKQDYGFLIDVKEGLIFINLGEGDSFITKVIGNSIKANFDFGFGWSNLDGVYFTGSAGLEITLPVHINLGLIDLKDIYIKIALSDSGIGLTLATNVKVKIGPLSAFVERVGLELPFEFNSSRKKKGFPISLGKLKFKNPLGMGVSINTSGLVGAGYIQFDEENKRYAGMLQLQYGKIGLVATTVITTRLPDGTKDFSILAIINVTFDPAITLPYNFKLHGVGGILGFNRRMDLDFIRDGISQGILDSILFPEGNVLLKIDQIISDLRGAFPPAKDRYVIGVMVKLSYSQVIFGDISIIMEIPSPIKIALLGHIYAKFPQPPEEPIVEINLGILGALDMKAKKAYLYLSIYDSYVSFLVIEGDAYVGFCWGSQPYFVLSLGGFHPADKSIPADIPSLKRLTISLAKGDKFKASLKTYLAVTPNSFAFGTKLDLVAKAAGFRAKGYMGFDILFIFSPFSFKADFAAGVSIYKGNTSLLSVKLELELSGPKTWYAHGKIKFKILFFDVSFSVSASWGSGNTKKLSQASPVADVEQALADKTNWSSVLPGRAEEMVTFKDLKGETDNIVVVPNGNLEIKQSVAPFNIKITNYKNEDPIWDTEEEKQSKKIVVSDIYIAPSNSLAYDYSQNYFSRPQSQKMSNREKLSSPSFELMDGGIATYTTQISDSVEAKYELIYETRVIDEDKVSGKIIPQFRGIPWMKGKFLLNGSSGALDPMMQVGAQKYSVRGIEPQISFSDDKYTIVNINTLQAVEGVDIENGMTYAQSVSVLDDLRLNSNLNSQILQIVPISEVI